MSTLLWRNACRTGSSGGSAGRTAGSREGEVAHQLDEFAEGPLRDLIERFHDQLLSEAARRSGDRPIVAQDLERAYRNLVRPDRVVLEDTQDIITAALRENRIGECVAYGMAVILFGAGLVLLFMATSRDSVMGIVGGTVA